MPPPGQTVLSERMEAAGTRLGAREALHHSALESARARAEVLHKQVAAALERFHEAAARAGAAHLRVELTPVRLDDKHVRAVEFELRRGRQVAIVTAKSRGDVTLVGPFRSGKTEGPCKTFAFDAGSEFDLALAEFLEQFLEESLAP